MALIAWPTAVTIKTWVKPGPRSARPIQDERLTPGDLKNTQTPEPALLCFETSIMDVKC